MATIRKLLMAGGIGSAGIAAAGANIVGPFSSDRGASPVNERENQAIEAALTAQTVFSGVGVGAAIAGGLAGMALGGSRTMYRTLEALREGGLRKMSKAVSRLPGEGFTRTTHAIAGGLVGAGAGVALLSEAAARSNVGAAGLQHDYLDATGASDVQGASVRTAGGSTGIMKGAISGYIAYASLGATGRFLSTSKIPSGRAIGGIMKNRAVRGIAALGFGAAMSGMMRNTQPQHNRIQGMGY